MFSPQIQGYRRLAGNQIWGSPESVGKTLRSWSQCAVDKPWRLPMNSRQAAEFLFQFPGAHLEECGAAMRAGVGHGAMAKLVDQVLEFRPGQGVVGLDRMAANRFGNGVFSQALGVDLLARRLELIHQFQNEAARLRRLDHR